MEKERQKIKIFMDHVNPVFNIIGSIIDIDYKRGNGLFWIQYPTNLKVILNKDRHRPNLFYFKDLKNVNYRPKIGEYISCNYIITRCGKLNFVNVDIDLHMTQRYFGKQYLPEYIKFKKKSMRNTSRNTSRNTARNTSRNTSRNTARNTSRNSKKCSRKPSIMRLNNRNTTKGSSSKKKNIPRVFIIVGHSSECSYDYGLDEVANKNVIDIIREKYDYLLGYHEYVTNNMNIAKTNNHKYFKQLKKDYDVLFKGGKVNCHIHPKKQAIVFCNTCFKKKYMNYFFCEKCKDMDHDKLNKSTETILTHKIINLKYRIDLKKDFKKYPTNKIKYLNGQTSGRSGFTHTSFNIMNYMQKMEKFREMVYNSKNMKDMGEIDKLLNTLNKDYLFHSNKSDTTFGIYPRKNKSGKIITGPKDSLISFFPSESPGATKRNEYLNGASWPLGIFELPVFDIDETQTLIDKYNVINNLSDYKFEKIFTNNKISEGKFDSINSFEPEWKFYSVMTPYSQLNLLKRTFLLEMPKNNKTKEEKILTSWKSEIKKINKYNQYLIDGIDSNLEFNPNKQFLLSELMDNIMKVGDIKPNEEVIFITNICRIIEFQDRNHYYSVNQTSTKQNQPPEQIKQLAKTLRASSRN